MAGTYEGLSVPIFGEFYRYTEAQTQTLYVEDSGVFNLDISNTTTSMDNALAVTYSASGTVASGYGNVFYTNLQVAGTSSGAPSVCQYNAFGADITINGTHTAGIGGLYIYIAEGTATLTSSQIYGAWLDIGTDLGATDYLTCLRLNKHNTTQGTTCDSFILFELQASGTANTFMHSQGTSNPEYFFRFSHGTTSGCLDATARAAATSAHNLAVRVGGTTFYIPMIAAT